MTKVIFRKFKDNGDIIAIFPLIPYDHTGLFCMSYMHIGQHGAAGVLLCSDGSTVPASEAEYQPLLNELIAIGYDDLKIIKRVPFNSLKARRDAVSQIIAGK